MKEPMKKLTVLSFYKDKDDTTQKLQTLGVIHLETEVLFVDEDLENLEKKKEKIKKRIDYLLEFAIPENKGIESFKDPIELDQIINDVEKLRQEKDGLRKRKEVLIKDLEKALPWGQFDRTKIERLEEKGISIRFFIAKKKNYKKFDFTGLNKFKIKKDGDHVYFVVVHDKIEEIKLPFEQIKMPRLLPSELEKRQQEIETNEEELLEKIRETTQYIPALKNEYLKLKDIIEYIKVSISYSSSQEGKIMSINGWYPEKIEGKLLASLNSMNISYLSRKPSTSDKVPVQLNNNRYSRLFEPVTKIFQLPNYYEFDLTPLIAVFYPIFFAYCLGDAGYGLIVMVISLIASFTFLKTNRNIAFFGLLLGAFTTVMGIVKSGSVFGISTAGATEVPFFQFLSGFIIIPDDRNFMFNAFNVSLMIGVVQILVGVATSFLKNLVYGSIKQSLPQAGKFLIIGSVILIFLAKVQDISTLQPYLPLANILMYTGILLVLLFHDLSMPIISRIVGGGLPLFFIFTGILGDVLSYVRLFALGVVSAVLGLVVNQIGMQIFDNGWWGIIVGVIFLLFGHSLNLVLAILGAIVHPLRLTFVEFYNNAQFEGGGIEYKPFKNVVNKTI